jgi:hypothetical protein
MEEMRFNPLQIELKQKSKQSGFTNNINGQSVIQDNHSVESHNVHSGEGQLRKPTASFGVDVIATPSIMDDKVNARSDDLLALQAMGTQPKHDLSGKAEVVSSLNSNPEISVSRSKTFTNCLVVRAETPTSRFQERRKEMAEIEHFLDQDWRFKGSVDGLKRVQPGQQRHDWFDQFLKGRVYKSGFYKDEKIMIQQRAYQACVYIALYDEDLADAGGLAKEVEDLSVQWKSSIADPVRGWVSCSYVPSEPKMGQCERTLGPSHVDDGGGDALESILMKSERTHGPSRGTGAALQRESQDMDRSSPDIDGPSSLTGSKDGTDLAPRLGSTDTCATSGRPSYT